MRVILDLVYLLFVIDDHTDAESVPRVRELVDIVIDVLHNPHKERPEGEMIIGQVAKGFVFKFLPLQVEGAGASVLIVELTDFGSGP